MDEQAFVDSPLASAFDFYFATSNSILELTGTIYQTFAAFAQIGPGSDELRTALGSAFDIAVQHHQEDHDVLHSTVLTAEWDAFANLVVDVCRTMFHDDPQLLDSDYFSKKKLLPVSVLALDKAEQINYAVDLLFHEQRDFDDTGVGKFEKQLDLVGLSNEIPADLRKAIVEANATRNVFAHNGGRADKKFVERCPDLPYSIGATVSMSREALGRYVFALQTYAKIIFNGYRQKQRLRPMQCYQGGQNSFKDAFNKLFPAAVPAEDLLRDL